MASYVSLGNQALIKLGHSDLIGQLTENTKAAKLVNAVYEEVRDMTLRDHHWNFAKSRKILAPSTAVPVFGSGQYFPHPDDWIRTIGTDDPYVVFSEEAEGIYYAGGDAFNLHYIKRITDPNKFDAAFRNCYTTRIAAHIAVALTGSKQLRQDMQEQYDKIDLPMARSYDGQEGGFETVTADDYIANRE